MAVTDDTGPVQGYPHDGTYLAASASTRTVGPDALPDPDMRLSGQGSSWGSADGTPEGGQAQ